VTVSSISSNPKQARKAAKKRKLSGNGPETGLQAGPQDVLQLFHPVVAGWFREVFDAPTRPQQLGWPAIARGESTLILAPTGTGKTLTAFLWCLNRLMFEGQPASPAANVPTAKTKRGKAARGKPPGGCRVIYVSPLKALAVDVERNLQSPLVGIANLAQRQGIAVHSPEIAIRTGDTSARERGRFRRRAAEILITTPESLYLLLTSQSAEGLRSVDTVIIDEIHALVPTKRGAHLALTLERLEALTGRRLQRIGLSATQRPLEEVARFLGGADAKPDKRLALVEAEAAFAGDAVAAISRELAEEGNSLTEENPEPVLQRAAAFRPVTILNASGKKTLKLHIEVPVEDMARLGEPEALPSGPASQGPKRTSIWTAIYPRLLELVRARTSTLLFVNSRRVAERLAGALNELAEEPLARAHHGSLAAPQRAEIEELLKAGRIKALVATSSLELGIDMGAIDLVIQIEAPPSVASGMQRIGRAGHQVGAVSEGILFPKFRADLVACAAVTRAMHEGLVESTRYLRNPLDVLAQQVVAIVAQPPQASAGPDAGITFEALYALVRSSAPFAELSRNSFAGVLDMLAGRYPSDEFAELRPRITWDRIHDVLTPREGSKSLAILNGGTIPDRGTFGVFLSGTGAGSARVGELDEEMVFESRTGDTFVLGATTWRIQEITRDRVEVVPAPGEPGKMPFWHGDRAGRPLEFGQRIGALVRELRAIPRNAAISRLVREHDLAPMAAENLLRFLADQEIATEAVPDDQTILVEKCRDELGDWRVCVLTPFGSRIHAPWAMAVSARLRASGGTEVETMWGDDGFVLRFPDTDVPPDLDFLLLDPVEASDLVLRQLGSTAMFAAKFRESAARALLLPRRRAQGRAPLWAQRKRAYDLLTVASRYPGFPILLEAYRECLRDVFDMPAFVETLRAIQQRRIRVHTAETRTPSPFASSLLFSYVANYIYDGDAPLAERRAQALTLDQDQLRELLGEADLRELLDADAIEQVEEQLQAIAETYRARNMDGVHDLLLRIGDLSPDELRIRCTDAEVVETAQRLVRARRALELKIAGTRRYVAMEDAGKYRDAIGVALPPGIPAAFLARTPSPVTELIKRFARTHGPFTAQDISARFALPTPQVEQALRALAEEGRVLEGGFRPGGLHREWCDAEVLRLVRRKSLAKLRKQIEAVPQATLARLNTHWQGIEAPRRGMDALLDAIELLQGAPLPASLLESEILPSRVTNYSSADIDTLFAAGELVWVGVEPLGERDGRIALYLTDRFADLWPPQSLRTTSEPAETEQSVLQVLNKGGAQFFDALHQAAGGGYPGQSLDALWSLVWQGRVTNDSFHALRAYLAKPATSRPAKRVHNQQSFRSRRAMPPSAQGRWSLLQRPTEEPSGTEWLTKMAHQMLQRYGVLVREAAAAEEMPGGFSAMYGVLKALEESGRIRRGYFVEGLGATQFALPAAVDLLRSLRNPASADKDETVLLAAQDPAQPYGSILPWPRESAQRDAATAELPVAQDGSRSRSLLRSINAKVVLRNGELLAYLRGDGADIQTFLPEDEPDRSHAANALAAFLAVRGHEHSRKPGHRRGGGTLIETINDAPAMEHFLANALVNNGYYAGPAGMQLRRLATPFAAPVEDVVETAEADA
jgi:ATP-dependent Lhr-like helicase